MNTFFEITALNQDLLIYLAIDISIAIVLLGAMRFISGLSAKVNSTEELAQKDNFAFGISVAGSVADVAVRRGRPHALECRVVERRELPTAL